MSDSLSLSLSLFVYLRARVHAKCFPLFLYKTNPKSLKRKGILPKSFKTVQMQPESGDGQSCRVDPALCGSDPSPRPL